MTMTETNTTNLAIIRRFWAGFNSHNWTSGMRSAPLRLSIMIQGCPRPMPTWRRSNGRLPT